MNILLYYPSNIRTIPIDIPLRLLKERGHSVTVLTTCRRGPLHELYESYGVQTIDRESTGYSKLARFISNLHFLIKTCRQYKIDIVHSHLQQTNLIAVFAQYCIKSEVKVFRHHCKYHFLLPDASLVPPWRERIADYLINKLAKRMVVPAQSIRNVLVEREGVCPSTVTVIPYAYDFESMAIVNEVVVQRLRDEYSGRLRIAMVSRLTDFKRHRVGLGAVARLLKQGLDVSVVILDEGPTRDMLFEYVKKEGMENRVHFVGFRKNIMDYVAWCDVLLHPSITEASNSAIKEAGVLNKTVIVCDGVGDFNEYLINGVNGFLTSAKNFEEEATVILERIYKGEVDVASIGRNLNRNVRDRFSVTSELVSSYEKL